jgi:uncharacterized protein YndB with AHSA1/START domain
MTSSLGTVDRSTGSVHLERELPVPPEAVWAAITDPGQLAIWLAPLSDGRVGEGSAFTLLMSGTEAAVCTVTAWEPPRKLALTWDYTGEERSEVTFLLSASEEGTRLVLDHVKIGIDPAEYGAGWHAHLDSLGQVLVGDPAQDVSDRYAELLPWYTGSALGTSQLGTIDRAAGSVHLERLLPASPEDVWDAVTTPERLADWLGEIDGKPAHDSEFTLKMLGGAVIPCTVTRWEPSQALTLRLDGEEPTELSFTLSEVDGQTLFVLHEEKFFEGQEFAAAGWHLYLDNLTAHLRRVPRENRPELGAGHAELASRYATAV